jgi:carbamoyltransferase
LAGGVFANVRINQELHKIEGVEEVFIHPGMSDEGLAVGAAMTVWAALAHEQGMTATPTTPLKDVYLGYEFSEREIEEALKKAGHSYQYHNNVEQEIAALLAAGHVVARFNGRLEYGPRALGNRSILYQPTDPTVNDWLNKDLVRTEFMPFAPSTMAEHAEQCFVDINGAKNAARFMTITFDCTDWMKKHCGGVVHKDGTARPQLVREEDNPSYYRILEGFYELTGLPSVINTSFNMHEEPIVCTPADAIRAFEQGHLDYLAMGNFLLKQPGTITHPLKPVPKVV